MNSVNEMGTTETVKVTSPGKSSVFVPKCPAIFLVNGEHTAAADHAWAEATLALLKANMAVERGRKRGEMGNLEFALGNSLVTGMFGGQQVAGAESACVACAKFIAKGTQVHWAQLHPQLSEIRGRRQWVTCCAKCMADIETDALDEAFDKYQSALSYGPVEAEREAADQRNTDAALAALEAREAEKATDSEELGVVVAIDNEEPKQARKKRSS